MTAEEQCIEDNFVYTLSVEQRKLYQLVKKANGLDAYKAGMSEAAELSVKIIKHYHDQGVQRTWEQTEQQILTAMNNKTTV